MASLVEAISIPVAISVPVVVAVAVPIGVVAPIVVAAAVAIVAAPVIVVVAHLGRLHTGRPAEDRCRRRLGGGKRPERGEKSCG